MHIKRLPSDFMSLKLISAYWYSGWFEWVHLLEKEMFKDIGIILQIQRIWSNVDIQSMPLPCKKQLTKNHHLFLNKYFHGFTML